ncbi:MAG: mycothiol system anti-sigma-R factor [Actinomycetes bacterium]
MSCGNPHDMDCSKVLQTVYLYLDGEIDGSEFGQIREHLDECSPCLREYGIEREVKILVARSCCETAPDSLREAVVTRIRVVRAEMSQVEFRAD